MKATPLPTLSPLSPYPSELPQILQQPTVLTTVAPGQELRLVVVAEGPSMLNYQWYHNGHTIQYGASNELYFEQARPENEGDYCCGVSSDGSGSILSNIAQVKGEAITGRYRLGSRPVRFTYMCVKCYLHLQCAWFAVYVVVMYQYLWRVCIYHVYIHVYM